LLKAGGAKKRIDADILLSNGRKCGLYARQYYDNVVGKKNNLLPDNKLHNIMENLLNWLN
jgi:hypothetical protein